MTIHDFVSFLALSMESSIGRRIQYLEIGASVAKCLYTQINIFPPSASVFAFDIEDINPTLAEWFDQQETQDSWIEEELLEGHWTMRRKPQRIAQGLGKDTIKLFTKGGGGFPNLTYLAADEFNKHAWMKLSALKPSFNMILSDAMHTLEALMFEWRMIVKGSILDLNNFTVVWDDCQGGLRRSFYTIVKHTSIAKQEGLLCHAVLKIHGWMGIHEYPHSTCVMTTLDLRSLAGIDSVPVIDAITCTEPEKRNSDQLHEIKAKCRDCKARFGVEPLKTWGSLPKDLQVFWDKNACDLFSVEDGNNDNSSSLVHTSLPSDLPGNHMNIIRHRLKNRPHHKFHGTKKCFNFMFDPKNNIMEISNRLIPVGSWFANPALSLDHTGKNQVIIFKYHIWPFAYVEQSLSQAPFLANVSRALKVLHKDDDSAIGLQGGPIDARLLKVKDRLFMFFSGKCAFMHICMSYVEIHRDRLDGSLYTVDSGTQLRAKERIFRRRQKNWSPFEYKGRILLIYSIFPHRILAIDNGSLESSSGFVFNTFIPTENYTDPSSNTQNRRKLVDVKLVAATKMVENKWEEFYGSLRGGSQAIKINETHYLVAFHSSKLGCDGHVYFLGFYLFRSEPPFEIVAISPEPLRPISFYKRSVSGVYFTSGIVLIDNQILRVSYGKNDCEGYLIDFKLIDILESLNPIDSLAWGNNSAEGWEEEHSLNVVNKSLCYTSLIINKSFFL